jgi:hypothetical protein
MADAQREGLKAAADRFATAMRKIARVRTQHTADAVHVAWDGADALVQAGHEGGAWGWEPIQALMFDNNKRHPLFGDKNKWYKQGRWPITAYTERAALDSATEAFADAAVPILLGEHGFTE